MSLCSILYSSITNLIQIKVLIQTSLRNSFLERIMVCFSIIKWFCYPITECTLHSLVWIYALLFLACFMKLHVITDSCF